MPLDKLFFNQAVNRIFLGLNVLASIINSALVFYSNIAFFNYTKSNEHNNMLNILNLSSLVATVGIGLLQIVSGIFLGYAIFTIRKFLRKSGSKTDVNTTTLAIHSISFGLYMVSIVIQNVFYVIYNVEEANN